VQARFVRRIMRLAVLCDLAFVTEERTVLVRGANHANADQRRVAVMARFSIGTCHGRDTRAAEKVGILAGLSRTPLF